MKHRLVIAIAAAALLLAIAAGAAWAVAQPTPAAPTDPAAEPPAARPADLARSWSDWFLQGTVTAFSDGQATIERADGETATLQVDKETRLWVPGQPPTTTISLDAGDPILVLGRPLPGEGDVPTIQARLILVAEAEDLPRYVVRGRVLVITRQTVVVQAARGERALTILPRTQIWSLRGRLDSLRGVQPGDQLLALGQPTELGQWMAGAVLIAGGPELSPGAQIRGEVTAIDLEAGTLTVEAARGPITVAVDQDTRYRVPGIEEPGLADVQVGDPIVAVGRLDRQAGMLVARTIGVLPPPEADL